MIATQLLMNGIIAGSIYALVASGFSLIYSGARFVHFAHGTVAAAGAYILYALFRIAGLPFSLAVVLTIPLTGVLGAFLFALVYRPLQRRKSSSAILLIASIGLMIIVENSLLLFFGADVKTFDVIEVSKGKEILGAIITPLQMGIVATALALLVILYLFVKKTRFGKKMLAVSDNPDLADISGINATQIQYAGFFLGSMLAGVAGILIGLEQNLEPTMGTPLIIKGFTGAVIGGMGSLPGSVLGSYLLGIVENIGIWYMPSGYKDAIAFVLLLVFLLIKPEGILGVNKGMRQ